MKNSIRLFSRYCKYLGVPASKYAVAVLCSFVAAVGIPFIAEDPEKQYMSLLLLIFIMLPGVVIYFYSEGNYVERAIHSVGGIFVGLIPVFLGFLIGSGFFKLFSPT